MLGVEARLWVRVQDADLGEQSAESLEEAVPGPPAPLAASANLTEPEAKHRVPERSQSLLVARNGVILEKSPHHRLQPFDRLRQRVMHAASQLGLDLLQLRCHPFADCRTGDDEIARLPVSPTDVSETEKVEGFRTSLPTQSPSLGGIAPEFNQARFLWVEFQTELRHALLQFQQQPRSVFSMLKPQHGVVSIADDNHVARCFRPPPLVYPEVEDVMQVEIGQGRRNHRTLGRPFLRLEPPSLLHDPRLQPFLDEADDTSVSNAMLDKALHPLVIDLVEERSDVQVEHPVHFLARDPGVEGIQRVVLAAPRPEPIREAQKVLFPHAVENRPDGMLDDLILQRCDAQRPLPAIAFRYPDPA